MPLRNPRPNAPTSERSFTPAREQVVTSQREPIYADYSLPELQDLRNLQSRRRQAYDLERPQGVRKEQALASAKKDERSFHYEPFYGQLGANYMSGGVFGWQPGMDYGTGTVPTALGYRKVYD